ncbi:tyrosine-type recombinase/integrase [Clostridium butyricum]|uniref:Site-specific recombinase, phage integrase family n=1 Tax=Clostridium butyricum E4 str. BoNT E BL5262 TaxID=632245 RepID=C4IG94_CLOBU|nr:tyrosine-type recombinase/integrase [Clostridium butyricum]EDT73853.1 site-specific recombinase, phage integrase family protein [Clostridium butyricum 5521]EEP54849.1 site-specific recombinase, phage integrase family [Clostridium butyricum E4 str. BoNT E BL5262]NFL31913.1 phage integrase family protein [Clostridium butyricum]NFS19400.1 phage integrase family protein [Clostridium butyricum]
MNKIKSINANDRIEFFYVIINTPIKDEMKYHICIYERNNDKVHPFTEYLKDKKKGFTLKNKSINTITNFHLTFIIRFLNFIFNDSRKPISRIEDLTLDTTLEFLEKLSQGELSKNNSDWKSKEMVNRANYAISHFIYWLCYKREKESNRKRFKMKYIKEQDFTSRKVIKHSSNGYCSTEEERLNYIVNPITSTRKNTREKNISPGDYAVKRLLELSLENDPMLTFGIVLGAYCGLRVGYISQMVEMRIKGLHKNKEFGATLDFSFDSILRSDIKTTGNIKSKIIITIHPGFARAIYTYYEMHIDYLKSKGLYPNKYGALFINNRGFAMSYRDYLHRFDKLTKLLDVALKEEILHGNIEAIKEEEMLANKKLTPHSLRHYFKGMLKEVGMNKREIQFFMAHESIESQECYADKISKEIIRKCQDKLYIPVKDGELCK